MSRGARGLIFLAGIAIAAALAFHVERRDPPSAATGTQVVSFTPDPRPAVEPLVPHIEPTPELERELALGPERTRVLYFFAPGLTSAIVPLAGLGALSRRFASTGVEVIGLPMATGPASLEELARDYRVPFRLLATAARNRDWARQLGVTAFPALVVLAGSGAVRQRGPVGPWLERLLLGGDIESVGPDPAARHAGAVTGRALFVGQPLARATAQPPRFFLRDEWGGERLEREIEWEADASRFVIPALPPGTYLVEASIGSVGISEGPAWSGSTTFAVVESGVVGELRVALERILRLREPVDTALRLPPLVEAPALRSPLRVVWEGVAEADRYQIRVTRLDGGPESAWQSLGTLERITTDNAIELELEPGGEYELALTAFRGAETIGHLEVRGADYRGWSWTFRVAR